MRKYVYVILGGVWMMGCSLGAGGAKVLSKAGVVQKALGVGAATQSARSAQGVRGAQVLKTTRPRRNLSSQGRWVGDTAQIGAEVYNRRNRKSRARQNRRRTRNALGNNRFGQPRNRFRQPTNRFRQPTNRFRQPPVRRPVRRPMQRQIRPNRFGRRSRY